jgi:hypothetical protein
VANKKEVIEHYWSSDDFNRVGTKCSCCGDNMTDIDILRTAPNSTMCLVCSDEIHRGEIVNQNISFFGGRSDYNWENYENEMSGGQSNAIKAIEGPDGIFDDLFN